MAAETQKSALNVVMGAMTFGEAGKDGARVHDIKDVEAILEAFRAHGHTEIDSARTYTGGTSEEYLGKLDLVSKGFKIETKLSPRKVSCSDIHTSSISHNNRNIRISTNLSHMIQRYDLSLGSGTKLIAFLHTTGLEKKSPEVIEGA
ncbi:hypothetical protein CVT26_009637 [Gymnopilus dilepis]|uniref:NADP-dependent oxidoreductase domain-containing protein n=1 Tax=Gymnopilus dilepis TaxID=231916 RepID=A0A409VKU7_9AGAR|nr:hypothetical protein CVT26_009637 [Gymnopilus dilepis]